MLWCLGGHFACFWLGNHLWTLFPIICQWKSIKIQQKSLQKKQVLQIIELQITHWKSEPQQNLFIIWKISMRTRGMHLKNLLSNYSKSINIVKLGAGDRFIAEKSLPKKSSTRLSASEMSTSETSTTEMFAAECQLIRICLCH